MQNALKEMDSEWDRHIAKMLIAGDKTHADLQALGISDINIKAEYERMNSVIEELQNTRLAASDMVELQLKAKLQSFNTDVQQIQNKLDAIKTIWDKNAIRKLENALLEKTKAL